MQGVDIPRLGLGTWRLTGATCQQVVEEAIEIGYRHIDTAQAYGNEADVGSGIAQAGAAEELFVTTKIAGGNHSPDAVRASTDESLEKLRIEAIDLLLIHQPTELDILEETLGAMQDLRAEGMVRHLGVSNFPVAELERALDAADLLAIQIEYHPFRRQDEQLAAARRHDLLFQAYSPLARGAADDDGALVDIARDAGATPAQVALRWLLDQDNVVPIPKASSREHLEENWSAQELQLGSDHRSRVDDLTRRERAAKEIGD